MRTTQEYLSDRKMYQRQMSMIKKNLPKHWVKIIMDRRKKTKHHLYLKLYNDLVNIVNGRSYKAYLSRKELVKEVIELSNHNKQNNESETI